MYLVHTKPTKKRQVLTKSCELRSCFKCRYNKYCSGCDQRCDAKFDVDRGECAGCDRVCQLGKRVPEIDENKWNFVPDLSYVEPIDENILFQVKGSAYNLKRHYVVSIRKIFNQRFSTTTDIKARLNIPSDCKVYLTFCVKDELLEKFWEEDESKWDKIAKMGFDGVFSPNYSLYSNVPMSEKVWNWYRQRESIRQLSERKMNVIPEVSFTGERELEFCCDWLNKTNTRVVYVTYQTVAFRPDTKAWKDEMRLLEKAANLLKGKQFVIVGAQIKKRRESVTQILNSNNSNVIVDDICYRLSDCMLIDKKNRAPKGMTKKEIFKTLSERQLRGEFIEN